jgi:hypothetical protein
VIGGRGSGLQNKNILPPDVFLDLDKGFSIRKCADLAATEWNPHVIGDFVCQRQIGGTAKNFHIN